MKTPLENTQDRISKYVPHSSLEILTDLLREHQILVNIKSPRTSKLGDFRPAQRGSSARISINANLNPYAFLITLLHEIAHWLVWEKYASTIKPHGTEWKNMYKQIIIPFLNETIFPKDILNRLKLHMINPKASSSSDIQLAQVLKKYDTNNKGIILNDLQIGDSFFYRDFQFRIIKKNRTRYLCQETTRGRKYLIHGLAEVIKHQ